jgi:hypothetical protein
VTPPMRLIEKLSKHSYITLKHQSLDKISISGGFFEKNQLFNLWR